MNSCYAGCLVLLSIDCSALYAPIDSKERALTSSYLYTECIRSAKDAQSSHLCRYRHEGFPGFLGLLGFCGQTDSWKLAADITADHALSDDLRPKEHLSIYRKARRVLT